MFQGELVSIYITEKGSAPMQEIESAVVISGRGIEGDRYFRNVGTFSETTSADTDVTLIELEAVEAAARDNKVTLAPHETRRRNLLTRDVPLNHLVGREFSIGEVILRGVELCEPCKHLERLTREGVLKAFLHRGGLRAVIVRDGTLRTGDAICPVE